MIQHHVFYGLWFMGTAHLPEWTVLEQCWTAMINIISTSGPFPESEVDMFDMSATDVPGEKPSSELHAESTLEPFWSWDNDQRRSMRWDDGMIPTNASWDSWSFCLHLEVSIVMGVPKNSWFIMEIPIQKDDDWGYPYFRKTPFGSFGFDWNLGAPLGIFPPCKESTGVGMGVAGIIMNDFYGSFPHSLHLAPVRLSIHEISIESPEVFFFAYVPRIFQGERIQMDSNRAKPVRIAGGEAPWCQLYAVMPTEDSLRCVAFALRSP